MADAEFTITGRTQVDTSGMKDLADTAKDAKDAIDKITATPDAAPKVDATGIEGIKEAAEDAAEALDGMDGVQVNFEGMGADQLKARIDELEASTAKLEKQILKASEAADNLKTPKGIEDANARIDEMSQRLRPMQQELTAAKLALQDLGAAGGASPAVQEQQALTDALHNTTTAADTAAQAVSNIKPPEVAAATDIIPDLSEPAQNAMAALDGLLERYRSMIETMQQKGAMTVLMDDAEGTTLSLADLKDAMQQVIDMQIQLAEGGGLSAGDDMDANIQEIVANYEKEEAAAEKAATKAEQEAEKVIAAYQKQAQQSGKSLDELEAALEDYKRKMEEAAKAGDKIGQADAIKGIESTSRQIKALTVEQNTNARASQTMVQNAGNVIRMFTTGQISARGFAMSIRGIGKAIKTGLGPIGWAILLVEALCASFSALIDWVKGWGSAAEAEAKRAGEAFKKNVEEAQKAEEDLKKLREKMDSESGVRALEDYRLYRAREITEEYDKQTARIEKQYRMAKYGLDEEYDKTEHEYNIKALDLKKQAADEGWSRQKLNDALEANEISRTMALNVNKEAQAHAEVVKQTRLETEEKDRLKQIQRDYEKANKGLGSENSQYLKQYRDEVEVLAKKYESLKKIEALYDPERMADMERLYGKWDGTDGSTNGLSTKQEKRLARNLGISLEEFRDDPALVREKMNDIRGQVDSLRDLPKVTQQLKDIAGKTGIDATDNDGNLNAEKFVKVYSERVDMSIKLSEEINKQNQKIAAAAQAKEGAEHKEKMMKLDSSQFKDISAATQSTKTAERKRTITDFKNEKEREDAIRKATDKELQGMLKQLSDLLATQVNDPEEYKKTQGQIDEINAQIKKRQQDAEKEQKKREKIEAKARKEATTKKQVEQLGWVIDKVEGTLSSDADLGTKLNQLGEVTNKITKDKSQITDELLEYVKSGLEQLAEAAKNQQAQASKLAAISKQLDATNTALAAAQKQIKNMPH